MPGTIKVYYRTKAAFERNPLMLDVGDMGLDRDDYEFVTALDNAPSLEEIFRLMNVVEGNELPVKLKVRSMMVGDVVVDENGEVWYCASSGWESCSW
jgi:hypothetical protein